MTKPKEKSLIDAIDTHAHVFHRGLKFIESRRFTPNYDAALDQYLSHLDEQGIARGVLIALSVLGTDNSYLLDSLRSAPERLRGVVAIDPAEDLDRLDDFASAGVVGVRVNLTGGLPVPDFRTGAWSEVAAELARRDWHLEINDRCERLTQSIEPLIDAGVRVVVDHFGMPDAKSGVDDPAFQQLLSFAASRRVWVKLSGDYRFGAELARQAAPLLVDSFKADRLLWASDWPFTQHEGTENYRAQLSKLETWVPNQSDRHVVLCETPAELFKFDKNP
ncbi:amidohydrolase family protein [Variovorax ureilyticus]|uniref:Amidohydrolase family protein n=1 Tax=Variovorax ureilyticus TaxID=1836198 RepID=A0ABU8VH94_9BURK